MADASLKCVVAWSGRRWLCSAMEEELRALAGEEEVRRLGDETCVVYTGLDAAEVRDRLRRRLEDAECLLVVEFERWSGLGDGVDAAWLSRRGH